MGSLAIRLGSVALGVLGLILLTVCCASPRWMSWTEKIESQSGTVEVGLWKICWKDRTGHIFCTDHHLQSVTSDLQPIRAMTVISCMLTYLSFLILLILSLCANFIPFLQNEDAKPKVRLGVGLGLLLAGLLVIISVGWFPSILQKSYVGGSSGLSKGAGFYAGLAASALLLSSGGLLCYHRKNIP